MSDVRPSKLHDPAKALEWWRAEGSKLAITELYEAVTDPVAVVRRGVGSGTIKGGEGWFCNSALAPRCTKESHADVVAMFGGHSGCQRALIIPVSDGGSET